jgi:enamine deaminase RidA (YjgF/YER057c/UK114 family)
VVISEGGKTIWLAGQTTTTDESGNDISGEFEEQARTCFALIETTLARAGASQRHTY